MDPATGGRLINPRKRRGVAYRREKSPPSSSSPQRTRPRKKPQKKKKDPSPEPFWALKDGIVDEKTVNGKVFYLVDWADDPRTGEPYPRSWEPHENITADEIARWQERKASASSLSQPTQTQQPTPSEAVEDSQPVRPAKRRITLQSLSSPSQQQSSPKKQRRAEEKEIKDSYEDEQEVEEEKEQQQQQQQQQQPHTKSGNVQVQISLPEDFDRDTYGSVVTTQQSESPELQSSPSQLREILSSSQAQTPARRALPPYIWDEDIEVGVIPDSQEERPSSSYILADTQISTAVDPQEATTTAFGEELSAPINTQDLLDTQEVSETTAGSREVFSTPSYAQELPSSAEKPRETQISTAVDAQETTGTTTTPREELSAPINTQDLLNTQEEHPSSSYVPTETRISTAVDTQEVTGTATETGEELSAVISIQDPDLNTQEVTGTTTETGEELSAVISIQDPDLNTQEVTGTTTEIGEELSAVISIQDPDLNTQEVTGTTTETGEELSAVISTQDPDLNTQELTGTTTETGVELSAVINTQDLNTQEVTGTATETGVELSAAINIQDNTQDLNTQEVNETTAGSRDPFSPPTHSQEPPQSSAEKPREAQISTTVDTQEVTSTPTRSREELSTLIDTRDLFNIQEVSETTAGSKEELSAPINTQELLNTQEVSKTAAGSREASSNPTNAQELPSSAEEPHNETGISIAVDTQEVSDTTTGIGEVVPSSINIQDHVDSQEATVTDITTGSGEAFSAPIGTQDLEDTQEVSGTATSSGEKFSEPIPRQNSQRLSNPPSIVQRQSQASQHSHPSQISQRPQSEQSSAQSHLPSPPLDEPIPSIERELEFSSPPPRFHSRLHPRRSSPPFSSLAQLRPPSFAPSTMEAGSADPPLSTREKLRIAMEKAKIKKMAEQAAQAEEEARAAEAARAASLAALSPKRPTVVQNPILSQKEINQQPHLSNQEIPFQEIVNPAEVHISTLPVPNPKPNLDISHPTSLELIRHGHNEYPVPLPLNSSVRDIYQQTLINYKEERIYILEEPVLDAEIVQRIDKMLDKLGKLCDHQDLIIDGPDPSTQRMDTPSYQAKWAEDISTKCMFLAEFLPVLKHCNGHVVLVVRGGRMLEILESLCTFHGLNYSRANHLSPESPSVGLKITLVPSDIYQKFEIAPASVVIAFDSTAWSAPYLRDLRNSSDTPILSLIVVQSLEHLDRCFEDGMETTERKIKLVSCLTQIKDRVGKLGPGEMAPPEAARAVADFLLKGTVEGSWPLRSMPIMEGLTLEFESSQPNTQTTTQSYDMPPSAQVVNSLKRSSDTEMMDTDSPKRPRISPAPGDVENLRISDSVLQNSSARVTICSLVGERDIGSLLQIIKDLELQLLEKDTTETSLRDLNTDLQNRVTDLESSLTIIQPKYQEALNDRGHFNHEIDLTLQREAQMRKDRDSHISKHTKLLSYCESLNAELTETKKSLATSSIPALAEMQRIKSELASAKQENEKLKHKVGLMDQDLTYTREQYQNASTSAAESASEITALTTKISSLEAKADNNRVQIHAIQQQSEIKEYLTMVRELKARNSELENELDKKNEELRALLNGRRATRGTSVPHSPRMGTMSPRVRGAGIGVSSGIGGSRGNSPAPGEMFGGALYGGNGSGRWGNHLL